VGLGTMISPKNEKIFLCIEQAIVPLYLKAKSRLPLFQRHNGFRASPAGLKHNNRCSGIHPEGRSREISMRLIRSICLCALASALLASTAAVGQGVAPTAQIVNKVNENNLVTLRGNTVPMANAKNDRGPVSPDLPMNDLILVMSRSPQQQAAFDKFVASQYDPKSENYHHWLQPEEVGTEFGPAQTDIDTVTAWLTGHGFKVNEVSKDHTTIRFSGTAGQVVSAFHTQIHNLEVKGVPHIANMTDPQIPAALVPAVVGVKALHDFTPKPLHRMGSQVILNRETGKWQRMAAQAPSGERASTGTAPMKPRPQFATTDSNSPADTWELVTPYDFAAIYNVTPAWNAGINGKGQTIVIAGTSPIETTDVSTFRSEFGLPALPSLTTKDGNSYAPSSPCTSTSPTALCGIGDLTENSLDVEWSGAVAPGADLVLVVSGYNSTTNPTNDPVYDSSNYAIENNLGNILNVSYGLCELGEGTTGNVSYYNLWEKAASQGISVFVAAGDTGSASCDAGGDANGTPYAAEYGLTVSGVASTPYNTAVGGTDFNWCPASSINSTTASVYTCSSSAAQYWSTTNNSTTKASALGYVPEIPWNDSCASPSGIAIAQELANDISVTSPVTAQASCAFYVNYYQYIYEVSGGQVDVSGFVDTVGGGGGASNCVSSTSSSTSYSCSASSAVITSSGSVTLVNGGWPKPSWQANNTGIPGINTGDGVRDLPDVSFFAADGVNNSAYLICVSANGSCTYTGTADNTPLIAQEVGGTSVASPAMAGVMALINQKAGSAQGLPNAELYSLAAKQTYSNCSTETVTASSSCYFNDIAQYTSASLSGYTYTNAQPCDDGDFGFASPDCVDTASQGVGVLSGYNAGTGYDLATGLGSLNVSNVVNGWPAATASSFALSNSGAISIAAGATTGNTSTITVTPSGGFTGAVSLTCAFTTNAATSPATCAVSPTSVTISGTTAQMATLTITTTGTTTAGAYSVTVTGTSGSTTETTAVAVTVTSGTPTGTFALSNSGAISVAAGATTGNTSTITVTPSGGFTGTVNLTCAFTSNATTDPAACSVSPSVNITGSTAATATLTITTTAATSAQNQMKKLFWPSAGGTALALVLLFGIPRRRRNWMAMIGLLILLASVAGMGCGSGGGGGGGGGGNPGTTPGTYAVMVTGMSGSITESTTVSITVQ
jgi:Pro-kumamolisin, activation domain